MKTLAELLKEAEAAEPNDEGGGYFVPGAGTYRVEVIGHNLGETRAKYPKFGFHAKVLEGDEEGNAFWFNVYLSASPGANNRAFGELAVLGIERETILSGEDIDNVASTARGTQLDVEVTFEADKKEPSKSWMRTKLVPLAGGSGWQPPAENIVTPGPPAI